jgi:TolB-like protein/TPR repeat protein
LVDTRRGRLLLAVGTVAAVIGLVLLGWRGAEPPLATGLIAILPFQVASPDSSSDWSHEELVDRIAIHLTDEGGRGSADAPRAVAVRRGTPRDRTGPMPLSEVLETARELGATWAINGSGLRSDGDLLLSADLVDVLNGSVLGRVSARGHPDSIARLADSLAVRIAILQGGDDSPFATVLPTMSVPAIRSYLAARRALGRGDWASAVRGYDEALRLDTAFASAALGMRLASGLSDGVRAAAAESIAYVHRDRLTVRERETFLAELGPGYPGRWYTVAERLRTWRTLVSRDPDNADAWFNLGLVYYHAGNRIDHPNAIEEARIALERALNRGTTNEVVALLQLQAIAGVTGDSALLERVISHEELAGASGSDTWQQWLRAFTRRDTAALALVRPSLRHAPEPELRGLWVLTQRVGFDVEDGRQVMQILADRARNDEDLSVVASIQYHLALNGGRPSEAQLAARRTTPEWRPLSRLAVHALSAMYGDGDAQAGAAAAQQLASEVLRPLASDAAELRSQMIHVCISAQWSLLHDETGPTQGAIDKLRTPEHGAGAAIQSFYDSCALTLAGWRAVIERRPDARTLVTRLDSLQREGTAWHWALPEHRVTARLWTLLNEPELALRAIRRRRLESIGYLAADLRVEGDIALRAADTASAMAAWRHHLALRVGPEAALRADTDSLRTRLRMLEARVPR